MREYDKKNLQRQQVKQAESTQKKTRSFMPPNDADGIRMPWASIPSSINPEKRQGNIQTPRLNPVIQNKKKLSVEEKDYGVNFDLNTTDKQINKEYEAFKKAIESEKDIKKLEKIVKNCGLSIWNHATQKIQASTATTQDNDNWNDKAIYRARLKMRIALKESKNPTLKDDKLVAKLIGQLEQHSRGMTSAEFDKKSEKKILISGFDPFQGMQSNISGVAAMNFDGKKVGKAECQSVVFPVRYEDFDAGMVEKFFGPKINDVDAILTISYTHHSDNIDIDRFSANVRGGFEDNNRENATKGEITKGGQNFYESSLPYKEMLGKDVGTKNQKIYYNQSWEGENNQTAADKYPGGAQKAKGWNLNTKKGSLAEAQKSGKAKDGSGGNYLSNEIHYRVSALRMKGNKDLPQGHLHIKEMADKKQFMTDMQMAISRLVSTLK